ncbi:uncharacterized protein LOC128870373 [Anastrepha ludens]|uniref:uncharacterized protein LOC128870373 n=1 Tax=Anastrepha ludens TaxID=28586 RepID=UPI0023B20110|nr:uncharacterized protein LOC128870373 [Anastrepha ludens]
MELKLEPFCIPSFGGSAYKWLGFKDAFETLVHQRDLPVAYKLEKLRQAVKAESVPLVGLYSGGYEGVWTALKNRYDNPKQLAEIHVARFLNMKSQTEDTSRALLGVVDVVNESLRALAVMKLTVDKWDALAVPIVVSKLSTRTQREWCMNCSPTELSTLNELLSFLEKRAHSLSTEFCQVADHHEVLHSSSKQKNTLRLLKSNLATTDDGKCQQCRGSHKVKRCAVILALKPQQRFEALKRSNLCLNCLRSGHSSKLCSSGNCRQCGHRHHTIFCRHKSQQPISSNERRKGKPDCSISYSTCPRHRQGSQATGVSCIMRSWISITPAVSVDIWQWRHLANLQLAHPYFGTPGHVDVLLGADVWGSIVEGDVIHGGYDEPHAQLTRLGWVVFGPASVQGHSSTTGGSYCPQIRDESYLEDLICNFWKLEEVPVTTKSSDDQCERFFAITHQRMADGRYVVRLPFRQDSQSLGDSYVNARRQFWRLERPIQDSLINIILRFQRYAIAITADVEKMFRQVLVTPQDREFQRIL